MRLSRTLCALAFCAACSADDNGVEDGGGGHVMRDAPAGAAGASDARSDQSAGGGGAAGTGPTIPVDVRDSSSADGDGASARDASASDSPPDVIADRSGDIVDAAATDDVDGDAANDASAISDADASSCTTMIGSDASPDGAAPGTITDLSGYTAVDVLYGTWTHPQGYVPRNRILELRFDPSAGACSRALVSQRKANGSQLQIILLRANFLMAGQLPSFFVPGTYPIGENVYEQDAGIASVADVNVVTTDDVCGEIFTRATGGSFILTSISPNHAAGTFTATFDDAGTISGGFDVDLCFTAELPQCPHHTCER